MISFLIYTSSTTSRIIVMVDEYVQSGSYFLKSLQTSPPYQESEEVIYNDNVSYYFTVDTSGDIYIHLNVDVPEYISDTFQWDFTH